MRTYRPLPAILGTIVFLVVANVLLAWILPGTPAAAAEDEMWLVYFAMAYAGDPPDQLDQIALGSILARLDPAAEPVADRVTVLSYSTNQYGFVLEARHPNDAGTFRITSYGLD